MNNEYYVYKHTSPNGKVYIGITCQNPSRRWMNGFGYKKQLHFYNAILKYGWDNIKHEILCEGLTKEEACAKEIELIAEYKSNNPEFGYNTTFGGEGTVGVIPNEETRKKLSDAHKGKPFSESHRKNISCSLIGKMLGENHPMFGKKQSLKTRTKIAKSLVGHPTSDETRMKISKANYGNGKKVKQYDMNGNLIAVYQNSIRAEEETKICNQSICSVCAGKRKTAGGYVWKHE